MMVLFKISTNIFDHYFFLKEALGVEMLFSYFSSLAGGEKSNYCLFWVDLLLKLSSSSKFGYV